MIRSILFVPADSEKKLAKCTGIGADAVVLDLEDAVMPERKPLARSMARDYLQGLPDRSRSWVRVNDLGSGETRRDLAAVIPAHPAGILLPKVRGPEDFEVIGNYLDILETEHGIAAGAIQVMPVVTETPMAVLRLGEIARQAHPRLRHITWGAEDLSSALGAADPRTQDGAWRPVYEHARNQCLLLGHSLGAEVIDTVYVNFRDTEGLQASCQASRRDGFTGRIAIHPDQIPVINAAFTPDAAEIAFAQRIVAAFAGGAGALSIDGKMYDIPHLKAAQRLLATLPG